MKNSLQSVFSEVAAAASTTKKLLPFRLRDAEIDPLSSSVKTGCQGAKTPGTAVKSTPGRLHDSRRGAAPSRPGSNGESSQRLLRAPSKSKKPTSTPPHRNRVQEGTRQFTATKAQCHRKSQALYSVNSSSDRSSATLRRLPASSSAAVSSRRPSACSSKLTTRDQGSLPSGASWGAVVASSSRRRLIASGHGQGQARNQIELDPGGEEGVACCVSARGDSVRVIVRARPVSTAEVGQSGKLCIRHEDTHTVAWLGHPETRFTFDHVADEFVSQAELFQVAGLPMVDNCMAGYNSCIFAYGQTGSGKTHTMLGDIEHLENRGITPRVFEFLFAKIQKEEEAQKQRKLKFKCRCSFLEIFNEQVSDLLEPSTNLPMREGGKGVFVEGLLEDEVRSVHDVLSLLLRGATNRRVAATSMNRESSRSHSVFTCVIESQWECDSVINHRYGRLNLVDLAGSERQKDTGVDEGRLREAASINKSLSTLGLVIMALVDIASGKQRHVPYRDSKLTFLLQDSLGGNSKTTIIANISPSSRASSETLSTLKFAQRAKLMQNNAVINEASGSGDVQGWQEQIQRLKDELALVRRQSMSRVASHVCSSQSLKRSLSSTTCESTADPTRGSFLHFCRAAPSPPALNHEVESCQQDLANCRAKLEVGLHSHAKIASEMDELRAELESSRDECRKQKQELLNFQLKKASEDEALEAQQAHRQKAVLELKTQLQKSNLKADQEIIKRRQMELQLHEALQESTNLQTELKWTRDSLEETESILATFQRPEPALQEIGDPDAAYEAVVIGQLQTEIIEMHSRLEEERRQRTELELQIQKSNNNNITNYYSTDGLSKYDKCVLTTEIVRPCNAGNGKRIKIKHQDAILQLQMELDSVSEPQGGVSSKLQLEIEALTSQLLEEKARNSGHLPRPHQHLESSLTPDDLGALKTAENSAAEAAVGESVVTMTQQEWEGAALRLFDSLLESLSATELVFEDPSPVVPRLRHAWSLVDSADEKLHEISDLVLRSVHGSSSAAAVVTEVVSETHQHMKTLRACTGQLRGLERSCGVASTMGRWVAEMCRFPPSDFQPLGGAWDERKGQLWSEKEALETRVERSIERLEICLSEARETEETLRQVVDVRIAGDGEAGRANSEQELEAALVRVKDLQHQIERKAGKHWVPEQPKLPTAIEEAESKQDNLATGATGLPIQRNGSEDATGPLKIPRRALAQVYSACSEPAKLWNSVTTEPFTTSKITVLQSCEELNSSFPCAGSVEVQLTRTTFHVLLFLTTTGSEANAAKFLSDMVAKIQESNDTADEDDDDDDGFAGLDRLESRVSGLHCADTSLAVGVRPELHVLKALVQSLDAENAALQHRILEAEANSTALKSSVSRQRELQETTRHNTQRDREAMLGSQLERAMRGLEKQVEEKQVEVEILGRSVEELENTVYALESQVGLLKREGDRQRVVREDLESGLLALQHQNAMMRASLMKPKATRTRESHAKRCCARSWGNTRWALIWKKVLPFPVPRSSLSSERKGAKRSSRLEF